MNDSRRLQINAILQTFSAMKKNYIELLSENNNLTEALELRRKDSLKKGQRIQDLINFFKNIISQNHAKVQSLQKEINHLQITVQDQNHLIEEHLKTIDKLNEELKVLKDKQDTENHNNLIVYDGPELKANKLKQIQNGNVNKFTHPVFDNERKTTKKSQRKARLPQFRWPNLDIKISGKDVKPKCISNTSSTFEKESNLSNLGKKRKLYCPDDGTVDLTNEE